MHIKVKELHPTLQRALEAVDYHKADISVEPRSTASMFVGGGAGMRGFAVLVDLNTDRFEVHRGSWGGANPWNPRNAVDLDTNEYTLPPNGAVINGVQGRTVHADITIHPEVKMFPAPKDDLTQEEKDALYCYRSINGGNYRKEELRRRRVTQATIDKMVDRGFLKRDSRGFCQITTEGKNAIEGYHGY